MTTADIARAYILAVGGHDLAPLDELLDDSLIASFIAPSTKAEWIAALDHLLPALIRNDIREVFVDGGRACVIYDFVTHAGTVTCVELLTVVEDRITTIELILDRVAFAPVNAWLTERAPQ